MSSSWSGSRPPGRRPTYRCSSRRHRTDPPRDDTSWLPTRSRRHKRRIHRRSPCHRRRRRLTFLRKSSSPPGRRPPGTRPTYPCSSPPHRTDRPKRGTWWSVPGSRRRRRRIRCRSPSRRRRHRSKCLRRSSSRSGSRPPGKRPRYPCSSRPRRTDRPRDDTWWSLSGNRRRRHRIRCRSPSRRRRHR